MKKFLTALCATAALTFAPQAEASGVLVAYFSWSGNATAEFPPENTVDAASSASMIAPGDVGRIARWIADEVGGDIFAIKVKEPYSDDYDECLDRAADEKARAARPKLVSSVADLSRYDTVFLGYPNWWYTAPMALFSFIEENNLAGKRVILFCAHGTGGLARSVSDIKRALPDDCKVEDDAIGVYRGDVSSSEGRVRAWARGFKL